MKRIQKKEKDKSDNDKNICENGENNENNEFLKCLSSEDKWYFGVAIPNYVYLFDIFEILY